ncbi:MAG TPA: hypothetical protein VMG11_12600 [Steroidobacteraceae bacterium]|nr:hypothetical protein [Steroidobacteraceae bacterium]
MTDSTIAAAQTAPSASALVGVSTRAHGRLFRGMSILMLAIVLTGFARTLFLRPLFHVPSIPWYLYMHGIVLTSWFALLCVQTSLIAARRIDLHRRLGILGGVLAIAVVGMSLIAVLGFPAHFKAGRLSIDTPFDFPTVSQIVWTDLASLAVFSVFTATALALRRRPEAHRRLMLLATIAILGPAAARAGELPARILSIAVPGLAALILVGLPLTLLAYDLHSRRRLHPATAWGVLAYFGAFLGAGALSGTAMGRALTRALE